MADVSPEGNRDPDAPALTPANPIALTDVLALGVRIEWTEAVAAVAELCALLVGDDPSSSWVPDAQDVLITAHGNVIVRCTLAGSHDIDDLGRLLHSLLDPHTTPMPLRLFLTQSIGFDRFGSVSAFADALAEHAGPGRPARLRAMYTRCLASVDADVSAAGRLAKPARHRSGPWQRAAVATLVILCAAAAAALVRWRSDLPGRAAAVAHDAADIVRHAAQGPRRADGASGESGSPPVHLEGGLAEAPEPRASSDAAFPDMTVYSRGSPGVEPPVMYLPRFPPGLLQEGEVNGRNTMELLVGRDGRIEEVKPRSRPVSGPDVSMLRAARTWRFHPALKAGKPVRYRVVLSWVPTPR